MMPDQSLMETDLHERKTYILLKEAGFLRMELDELTTFLKTLEPTCQAPDSPCDHCIVVDSLLQLTHNVRDFVSSFKILLAGELEQLYQEGNK